MVLRRDDLVNNLDNLRAIDHGVIAEPHTPVYKMHRYFARRPWSVFSELVKHYSNPGSIILDPFCGGGVTIIEGLKLRRKVVGVDLNPMATFITKMEVVDVDLYEIEKAFSIIEGTLKNKILELYEVICSNCNNKTYFNWMEWNYGLECPNCKSVIDLEQKIKVGYGIYQCPKCKFKIIPRKSKKRGDVPKRLSYDCHICRYHETRNVIKSDLNIIKNIESNFDKIFKKQNLWYPPDKIPLGKETNKVIERGFSHFYDLFTKRNLYSLSLLYKEIEKINNKNVKELFLMTLTSGLGWASKMNMLRYGSTPGGWGKHSYWVPGNPLEQNIWLIYKNRYGAMYNGKNYSNKEIGNYYKEARNFDEIKSNDSSCLIINRSSTNIPLPNQSVDTIITDPPYGGNVNYSELSDFWAVWLRSSLNVKQGMFVTNHEEAIVNEYQKKGIKDYRELMYKIFKECNRVLKDDRWMVMTFHNKDFQVWNSLHLAAHDSGFILSEEDGMIYQPPIQSYITTAHTRKQGGSMLGDFILSFKKAKSKPERQLILAVEIDKRIQELAAEAILHHKGATLSVIYMKLIPFLLNNNLLDKTDEKAVIPYLTEDFEEKGGKWYLKEKLGKNLDEYLKKYSQSHYKEDYRVLNFVPVEARLEYLIRRYLYEKGQATQDEILNEIYTNLINSNAAEYGEISGVLNRIASPVGKNGRKVWKLKEDLARIEQLSFVEEKIKEIVETSEESEHDLIIGRLVELGAKEGYTSHIGKTEQKKYTRFRRLSIPMADNAQYGIDKKGFDIITEIDVLWMKGDSIIDAFEVEKSTTIHSGIDRFRNLFAVQPNSKIDAFIVIPDPRENEAKNKISSPANRREGLVDKIGYILFKDLKVENSNITPDFQKIKRFVE